MLVSSVTSVHHGEEYDHIPLCTSKDRTNCMLVSDVISIQCILVFIGSASIMSCFWTPDVATMDYDKLVRIMYLFDSQACNYKLTMSKELTTLQFSNDTKGYNVEPINWKKAVTEFSTELAAATRVNVKISLYFHSMWFLIAISTRIFCQKTFNLQRLKTTLAILFYSSIVIVVFDVSMALLYISHIKQSLTKSMILRYSGWSSTLKLKSYNEFAGWLPMVASICWLRGIIILFINIYCCKIVNTVRKKIKRREIKLKYDMNEKYTVIPDALPVYDKSDVLVYRRGEKLP